MVQKKISDLHSEIINLREDIYMNFKTYYDLNADLLKNLYKIPQDIDMVIGVPRSGMILASMIAVYINKPLLDIQSFLNGEVGRFGMSKNDVSFVSSFEDIKRVLVVEDSVNTGLSIKKVKAEIGCKYCSIEFVYLAAYVQSESIEYVDIFFDIVEQPRLFEWNYLHHNMLEYTCCDIDGVLCNDPSEMENDDGERYRKFLLNTPVKLCPSRKVGWLVTSRLEKYRHETEEWLNRNGIEYNELVMMPIETAEERRALGNHGKFKADVYKKLISARFFIESNPSQAQEILNISKKPVFCIDNQTFYSEGKINKFIYNVRYNKKNYIKNMLRGILPKRFLVWLRKIRN